jgi:hypothetical protein
MPFVQMENISHFLSACQSPPLSLPPHDVFLTVDLFESKDPAQVLQCLGAFSRRANIVQPTKFPRVIGKTKSNAMSPHTTGTTYNSYSAGVGPAYRRDRGASNASEGGNSTLHSSSQLSSGRTSPIKNTGKASPSTGVSSWSRKADEGATMPAWNIAQYGYMGGASQGNMGITFGARRQITTPAPQIPSLAEKQRKRREEEARQIEVEAAERRRQEESKLEENTLKIAEQQNLDEATSKRNEVERVKAAEEKQRWEEEERRWNEEEASSTQLEAQLEEEQQQERMRKDRFLNGQFLSQYQESRDYSTKATQVANPARDAERERVKELERQLEEAKEREARYERERYDRLRQSAFTPNDSKDQEQQANVLPNYHVESPPRVSSEEHSWQADEQEHLKKISAESTVQAPSKPPRPLPVPQAKIPYSVTPLHTSAKEPNLAFQSRPLPTPSSYNLGSSRTDLFLREESAPVRKTPKVYLPAEASHSTTSGQDTEAARRLASQTKTKAAGWASKSLLEREMERERERQREWEESQTATREAAARGVKDGGSGPGESWDVNQYGYMGGDSQNRGGPGLGGRRQILGPRPKP